MFSGWCPPRLLVTLEGLLEGLDLPNVSDRENSDDLANNK